jgi:hypothetical protein
MIDFLRIVQHWHESKPFPLDVSAGMADRDGDGPDADNAPLATSRDALTMTRSSVQADMARMAHYFNIDLNALPHYRDELLEAENACAHCETLGRCHHWMHEGGRGDSPQLFCPNVDLFKELALDPFWAKAELNDWPRDPCASPWSNLLKLASKEVSRIPPKVGPDQLQAFAKAAVEIDRIAEARAPFIAAADGWDHAEELRREANSDMAAVIDKVDNFTLDDFKTIFYLALSDPAMTDELLGFLKDNVAA